jgi:polar amino acid transport system permease protein
MASPLLEQQAPTEVPRSLPAAAKRQRPGQIIALVAVVIIVATVAYSVGSNERFQWEVVADYFTSRSVIDGLLVTLRLTVLAMIVGVAGGLVLAVMRMSSNRLLQGIATAYLWLFRGTPLLVQLIFWFNISALYPEMSIGLAIGPHLDLGSANVLVTPYVAAILGLGLHESSYMCEVIRGGIQSVDKGQTEAADAFGMSRLLSYRRIILPQAMRTIIPTTGNQVILMLKTTSMVSVLAIPELLRSVQDIYSRTFETIPMLLVAAMWYLIVTSVLMVGQIYLERRFGRGVRS